MKNPILLNVYLPTLEAILDDLMVQFRDNRDFAAKTDNAEDKKDAIVKMLTYSTMALEVSNVMEEYFGITDLIRKVKVELENVK